MKTLETTRLIIRPFTNEDLPTLISLRSDDDVIRYIGGLEWQNPEKITARFAFYRGCYERYGFGMSALILKESGAMIGWCGLQPLEESGEIEVGYGMAREFWGRGFGAECAGELLRFGFVERKLARIVAVADPANIGSWRVMEKCGMKFEKTARFYGMDCKFYALSKEEFDA